ncbi:unnamed protein product [Lactuca saligna]|uniref:GRF-type domain-containing protein n=1 Tax=Lactuca saligna TaxID=75948 RepID=A0AA36A4P1_LACSI|nr:unnamed protein product [Lactuca saligna]
MDASSSSISSKQNAEFQPKNPCYCGLPSRVRTSRTKDNPGKKIRLCPNSMNEGPKCKFWEWLEPETPENEVNYGKDEKELCNLTLKVSILENEISILDPLDLLELVQHVELVLELDPLNLLELVQHVELVLELDPLDLLELDPLELVPLYLLYKYVVMM